MSGAVFAISSKVLKVFSGLASGSPGPAMPSTVICGMVEATASTFLAACSGRQLLADHAGARFIGAIVFAVAVVALDVAGRRHRDVHARVVMMRLFAVAGMVLDLLPDFRRQIALARRRSRSSPCRCRHWFRSLCARPPAASPDRACPDLLRRHFAAALMCSSMLLAAPARSCIWRRYQAAPKTNAMSWCDSLARYKATPMPFAQAAIFREKTRLLRLGELSRYLHRPDSAPGLFGTRHIFLMGGARGVVRFVVSEIGQNPRAAPFGRALHCPALPCILSHFGLLKKTGIGVASSSPDD